MRKSLIVFLNIYGMPSDVACFENKRALVEVVRRVDKRKAYYYCFHNMTINERKEMSLYDWVMKFHPFAIIEQRFDSDEKGALVNEAFAIYLIAGIVVGTKKLNRIQFVKKNYVGRLVYSFRYRSFTIESLMLLVESLSPKVFMKTFEKK